MLDFFDLERHSRPGLTSEINQMSVNIAFIGGGNMAASLVGGLLAASTRADQILVAEPDEQRRTALQQQFAVNTTADNTTALNHAVIILAVKPQLLQQVCRQLEKAIGKQQPLFISIAAGVRNTDINRWLGGNRAIVRCMPNTPSLLQVGASALFANESVLDSQKQLAEAIMQSVGITLWVDDEKQLDAVTALSGSGPAYFFLLMEAMQAAATGLGLDSKTAEKLTLQTALGAARMAAESDTDTATLRQRVTSKGGTTEQAIRSFEQAGFQQMVSNALKAASNRSETLADELGKDQS